MAGDLVFERAKHVLIERGRWSVRITIEREEGGVETYVASADHGLTYGDGIWFGTEDETNEELTS